MTECQYDSNGSRPSGQYILLLASYCSNIWNCGTFDCPVEQPYPCVRLLQAQGKEGRQQCLFSDVEIPSKLWATQCGKSNWGDQLEVFKLPRAKQEPDGHSIFFVSHRARILPESQLDLSCLGSHKELI